MGYTHYFILNKKASKKRWAAFTKDVQKILDHPTAAPLVSLESTMTFLPPACHEYCVYFNGKGEDGHEVLNIGPNPSYRFCKTAGKPYDMVVTAVLLASVKHLDMHISSDGEWDPDWQPGRELYTAATRDVASCPWPQQACSKCGEVLKVYGHQWGGSERCAKCGCGSSRGKQDGHGKWVHTCMDCGSTKRKRAAPLDVCYFCAEGYYRANPVEEALTKVGKRKLYAA